MNDLMRPTLYNAFHAIEPVVDNEGEQITADVVGPICETGDKLGSDRLMPPAKENDVILIANAGAYGYVMSSQYNRRDVAEEVVI